MLVLGCVTVEDKVASFDGLSLARMPLAAADQSAGLPLCFSRLGPLRILELSQMLLFSYFHLTVYGGSAPVFGP
jgi:hypothetical protein